MPQLPLALLVNARSRTGAQEFERAAASLRARGLAPIVAHALEAPDALSGAIADALASGARTLVVGGGDGTLATAAGHLAHRDATLGVLPLGTANSFARSLGLPTDVDGALDVIADGAVARVDLGRVGDCWFASSAAIGVASRLAAAEDIATLKRRLGRLGYVVGGWKRFARQRPFRVRITTPDGTREFEALEVVIANGRYHGGVLVTYQAGMETHDLVARVVKGARPAQLAYAWLRSALGRPAGREHVELVHFATARIDVDPAHPVTLDGEPRAHTPITAEVAPAALRVLVPHERVR